MSFELFLVGGHVRFELIQWFKTMWKQLSTKEIFNHPRLSLLEDEVELPNGTRTTYLKYKDDGHCAATLIVKRGDGNILLQKEYSYPINENLFQFPGGLIPPHEVITDGANRELMEEAGLFSESLTSLGSYLINNRRSTAKMHIFLAEDLKARKLTGDPEENIVSIWFPEAEIDTMIKSGKIINCHALAGWCLYKIHNSTLR